MTTLLNKDSIEQLITWLQLAREPQLRIKILRSPDCTDYEQRVIFEDTYRRPIPSIYFYLKGDLW